MQDNRIILDTALLTPQQQAEYLAWQELFTSPGWGMLVRREQETINNLQSTYSTVCGEQALGYLQGALSQLNRILDTLPDMINAEYLIKTGQLGQEEDHDTDDPVSPPDWSV